MGDGGMAHLRQQLPFDLEIGQVARIQPLRVQQLQRDGATHRLQLLGAVYLAHAAAPEQGLDAIAPEPRTRRQRIAVRRCTRDRRARRQQFGTFRIVLPALRHARPPLSTGF